MEPKEAPFFEFCISNLVFKFVINISTIKIGLFKKRVVKRMLKICKKYVKNREKRFSLFRLGFVKSLLKSPFREA